MSRPVLFVCLQNKLESEVQQLRGKVSGLQVDLENSEAVQRDFVKLSQSLQVCRKNVSHNHACPTQNVLSDLSCRTHA